MEFHHDLYHGSDDGMEEHWENAARAGEPIGRATYLYELFYPKGKSYQEVGRNPGLHLKSGEELLQKANEI